MNTWKVIQRRIYDILSHKYFLIVLFPCLLLTFLLFSIIQVGEVWSLWFGKRQNGRNITILSGCSTYSEIDAVYTWVNGSDPSLLDDLKHYQSENEEIERWSECPFPDCEPSHIVVYSGCHELSKNLRYSLPPMHKIFTGPAIGSLLTTSLCRNKTTSLIYFSSTDDAAKALEIKKINGTLSQGFWTTDHSAPGSHLTPEWLRLSGVVPKFLSLPVDVMKKLLFKQIHSNILEVWPNGDHSYVIIKLSSANAVDRILSKSRVVNLAGDLVVASRVSLVFNFPLKNRFDQYAPSRFEDKEELRYSLRSLEKHAPWIRHVYLVTNGQIPHWLDLDNPRITLVTHQEIFANQSHLPTFSSPAIESHLHRIKGLSNKFLYLNDDIMFTQDVWPEDFFTNSKGFKVYLSWPVPDCNPACLWSWVADGSCDAECNVAECGFDGGDCNETDISPNSLKIRAPREEFSNYDEFYDSGFENAFNMMKNSIQGNVDFLQTPGFDQGQDLPFNVRKGAQEKRPNEDLLRRLRDPPVDTDQRYTRQRFKRNAVKKNLASFSYKESSMVAGQSADFPGSVTQSKLSMHQSILVATGNLRDTERPRHRSPFPQSADNEAVAKDMKKSEGVDNIFHNISKTENGKPQGVESRNDLFQNNVGNNSEQREETRGRTWKTHFQNGTFSGKAKENTKVSHLIETIEEFEHLKNSTPLSSNSAKEKQHLHNLLENELNRSLDKTLIQRGNQGQNRQRITKQRILDSFAESLLYVNMLYNKMYGFETRRVPAHAPHFIDKEIMAELQEKFPKEWDQTSSHKLRSPFDMQYAFSYFYFLMSEEIEVTPEELFQIYDTDHSRTWSDREIRTLMTRLYPAPLNPHHLLQFEEHVLACAQNLPPTASSYVPASTPMYERYQDSPLPTVTWQLVDNCPELKKLMTTNLGKRKKYRYEVVREWSKDVTFKMLHSNVSHLVGHLDDIRRNPKKFVCLNDNLDPRQENENSMVRAVLRDFYHSFFPLPSKYELPSDMRNRFLHVSELEIWKESRARLRIAAILAVITLCLLTFAVICPDEIRHYGRRMIEISFCLQRRRMSRTRCKSRSPVRPSVLSRSV